MSRKVTVDAWIVEEPRREKLEIEVPIYREHNLDNEHGESHGFMMIDSAGDTRLVKVSIWFRTGNVVELEIDDYYRFDRSGRDYALGQGEYHSSREHFHEALGRARRLLERIEVLGSGAETGSDLA